MRRTALVALALVGVMIVATTPVGAAAPATSSDLVLSPAPDARRDVDSGGVRVVAQPGGGVWASAILKNRSATRLTVLLGGGDGPGAGDSSAWVRPAVSTVLLEPGQSTAVDFTVAPPRTAAAGTTRSQLIATVVDAPDVVRTLDLAVEVLGAPVPERSAAGTADPGAASAAPTGSQSDHSGSAADVLLRWGMMLALAAVVLRTFGPGARRAACWAAHAMQRDRRRPLDIDGLNRVLDVDELNRQLARR